ncbi:MAG TPA: hypothetical protein VK509_10970, partial [Polyangiales bacterium]|nr:hypothetical protein [Polyangiales bacterium]
MNEHSPITGEDASALDRYFSIASESSTTGSTLERAKNFGVAAIEDTDDKRARNAAMRRELIREGAPIASMPWDLVPLTARPTAETRPEPSYEPDYLSSALQAFVSRRLKRMAQLSGAEHVQVLQVYFGPIGNHYAVGFTDEDTGRPVAPLPRVFALLHVAPSGRKLLEKAHGLLAPSRFEQSGYA